MCSPLFNCIITEASRAKGSLGQLEHTALILFFKTTAIFKGSERAGRHSKAGEASLHSNEGRCALPGQCRAYFRAVRRGEAGQKEPFETTEKVPISAVDKKASCQA